MTYLFDIFTHSQICMGPFCACMQYTWKRERERKTTISIDRQSRHDCTSVQYILSYLRCFSLACRVGKPWPMARSFGTRRKHKFCCKTGSTRSCEWALTGCIPTILRGKCEYSWNACCVYIYLLLSICLSIYLSIYLLHLSIYRSIERSIYLFVCLFIYLSNLSNLSNLSDLSNLSNLSNRIWTMSNLI